MVNGMGGMGGKGIPRNSKSKTGDKEKRGRENNKSRVQVAGREGVWVMSLEDRLAAILREHSLDSVIFMLADIAYQYAEESIPEDAVEWKLKAKKLELLHKLLRMGT